MHVLLERIVLMPAFVEGQLPVWLCTRPLSQYAVGVWTWRRINGAWSEALIREITEPEMIIHRVRLVTDDWPGLPDRIELYDVIGDLKDIDDLTDRMAETEALLGALNYMDKNK